MGGEIAPEQPAWLQPDAMPLRDYLQAAARLKRALGKSSLREEG
jgi:hypothetical protein